MTPSPKDIKIKTIIIMINEYITTVIGIARNGSCHH